MKAINPILFGLACLFSVSAVAQKLVPHSFRYQAGTPDRATSGRDSSGSEQLRFLTQITQPNTTFLRLYFTGTQLGDGSYLVLEGTDGTRQELRKPDLENWHYSSAYFNGQSVNVSLFAAAGDRNTVSISGMKVSGEPASLTNKARPVAASQPAARQSATLAEVSPVTYPHAKAVGRFTNGTDAYGTGWIAPNGAIVTVMLMVWKAEKEGYDVIEFNVPASTGMTVQHPAPQDQYPIKSRNKDGFETFAFKGSALGTSFIRANWAVLEALPNGTRLRPGERQQEHFRIATNPSNYTIDAMGDVPVDVFHYGNGHADQLEGNTTFRTLRLTQTSLLKQNDYLANPFGVADRDLFVLYNMPSFKASHEGAPVVYQGSNVAIGVHNDLGGNDPGFGVGFQADGFRNGVARFFTEKSAYLDQEGVSDQPNGQIDKPYRTAQQAAQHAPNDYTVYIARGTYSGAVTFNRPLTLRAPVGKVVIGSSNGGARKSAESSVARNVAMIEASGAHSRLESSETAEKVRVYPNPFREQTEIKYPFAEGGPVSVRIVNTAGVPVATFTPNNAASGQNGVQWDGTDQNGMSVPAGLYIVKVNYGNQTFTTKVLKK
ncbi:T9SS type A sorting domain-containing protein [Larkinella sp. GY13]|uniref:T9SS type A sorting domain-containing protein n=1 Tax=Larkinella sp. GY13 TaxID=3453720 RepID=UPI003EE979F3